MESWDLSLGGILLASGNTSPARVLGYLSTAAHGYASLEEVRVLSDEEYAEYTTHSRRLSLFGRDQQLFLAVLDNYEEIERELRQHLVDNIGADTTLRAGFSYSPPPLFAAADSLNRRILNYLSSIRLFLDHADGFLKHRYGDGSPECRRFREAQVQAYDGDFAYRFVYRLRNYVQHCGMPISRMNVHGGIVDRATRQTEYDFALYFSRDTLLSAYDGWSTVGEEISSLPPLFDVMPHLKAMIRHLDNINIAFLGSGLTDADASLEYLTKMVSPMTEQRLDPVIFTFEEDEKTGKKRLNVEYFPLYVGETVKRIRAASREDQQS